MEDELPVAKWNERILFFLGRRHAFLVSGNSMSPTLSDGDAVLIKPVKAAKSGDLILASHPYKSNVKILKRVGEISDSGQMTLIGDNPSESTDSRSFGSISSKHLIGKVVCRLK